LLNKNDEVMNFKSGLFAIVSFVFIALGCSSDSKVDANTVASISIDGMTCEVGCAAYIQKTLAKTKGIESCEVDFENNLATVKFDNTIINDEEIVDIIESLNEGQYSVEGVVLEGMTTSSVTSSNRGNDEMSVKSTIEIPNIFSILKSIIQ
jgi:copper chaperone CopZ